MKIISDCWRHIALNDIDPDDIQRRPREGSNIEIQRRLVSDRKDKIEKLDLNKSVDVSNVNQGVTSGLEKTIDNADSVNKTEQTVQYL